MQILWNLQLGSSRWLFSKCSFRTYMTYYIEIPPPYHQASYVSAVMTSQCQAAGNIWSLSMLPLARKITSPSKQLVPTRENDGTITTRWGSWLQGTNGWILLDPVCRSRRLHHLFAHHFLKASDVKSPHLRHDVPNWPSSHKINKRFSLARRRFTFFAVSSSARPPMVCSSDASTWSHHSTRFSRSSVAKASQLELSKKANPKIQQP